MMKVNELATKSDIAAVKANIVEMKFELLKWIVGLALAQLGLLVGILLKTLG